MRTKRWFAKYETGSDRFGEQVSRNEFPGFDGLEDAQAFCEKNALDVERALRGTPESPLIKDRGRGGKRWGSATELFGSAAILD